MRDVDWAAELERKLREASQSQYFTTPGKLPHGSRRYGIQTLASYVFDPAFWRVFSTLPFKICIIRPAANGGVELEWDVEDGAELPLVDHHWRSSPVTDARSTAAYPFGLACSRCGLGLDRHPIQPGHVLPTGEYDATQA